MVKSDKQLYRFDGFQIDAIKRVLLRGDAIVQLPPKAFDLLLALVEHNQYVIEKDELMRLVWGERIVEENNLTRHISTLRKALEESPNDHRYIVTVPGRGYSFVASVESVPINSAEPVSAKPVPAKPNGLETLAPLAPPDQTEARVVAVEPARGGRASSNKDRWLLAAALIVVIAAAGVTALTLFGGRSKNAAVNSYRDWETVRLTWAGNAFGPGISPDGKYLAYVNRESGSSSIWIQHLATSRQQQIVPPEKYQYSGLHFSPDGGELYFSRLEGPTPMRTLYRIPVLGGVAKKLRDDVDDQIVLSPDGAHIAFTRRNSSGIREFVIANLDGVEERVLADQPLDFAAWSPDGSRIAFSVGNAESGAEEMSIHEINLSDGAVREISSRKWYHVSHKSWLPDGSGLIVCAKDVSAWGKQLWFVAYPSGEAWPLSNDQDSFQHLNLTADGRMLVAEQVAAVSDIWSARLEETANAKKIGVWGRMGLCLMANGRVVYVAPEPRGVNKIWTMNADGTERRQLTFDNGGDISPTASPDGRFIIFASARTGNLEIFRIDIDGSNLVQLTTSKGAGSPAVSPDGRWVIYLSASDDNLYRVPIEGGEPQRVAGKAVGVSSVSPDGKLIAYFAPGKNAWAIAVRAFKDGSVIRRFEVGSHSLNNRTLKWTPDGKALLYANITDGVGNIWMQPLDGGAPRQVTDFKSEGISCFDVTADGKDLVCARGSWKHDIVLIKNLR
ncbi:MAG TPA: winged helix-turn-helix domain-containing protein [Blastocatellia bacterium]|nr:winged helix-turn-helix domain-containing protein [Blastocatellia bacterium]